MEVAASQTRNWKVTPAKNMSTENIYGAKKSNLIERGEIAIRKLSTCINSLGIVEAKTLNN